MNPATLIFELPDASGDSRKMAHHDNYPLTVQVYRYHDYTVQTYKCVSTEFGQPAMGLNNFELLRNSATLGLKLNILQLLSLTLSEKLNVLQQLGQTSSTFCTQCNKALAYYSTERNRALTPCITKVQQGALVLQDTGTLFH